MTEIRSKCLACNKKVFKMEEVLALGTSWHKICFCCGGLGSLGCRRILTQDNFEVSGNNPYCVACFARLFKQGAARGAVLGPRSSSWNPSGTTEIENKKPSTTDKFRTLDFVDTSAKCPLCNKNVYKMEEVLALGTSWHKSCFCCGGHGEFGCRRVLSVDSFEEHGGAPYCIACFARLFKQAGARGSAIGPRRSIGSGTSDNEGELDDIQVNVKSVTKFRSADFAAEIAVKCRACDRSVYKMEEVLALGASWHKSCFCCGTLGELGCRRVINVDSFEEHGENAYCVACFARLFKHAAARGASTAPLLSAPNVADYAHGSSNIPDQASMVGVRSAQKESSSLLSSPTSASGYASALQTEKDYLGLGDKGGGLSERGKRLAGSGAPIRAMDFLTTTAKCPSCAKSVYKNEEVLALGGNWHKSCFCCGTLGDLGCRRSLTQDSFEEHGDNAYCIACFARLFKQGAARGALTSRRSTIGTGLIDDNKRHSSGGKFRSPEYVEGSVKCPLCMKIVYKMEEVLASGSTWHKSCFICGGAGDLGCKRVLTVDTYEEYRSEPYCQACYAKLYKNSTIPRRALPASGSGLIDGVVIADAVDGENDNLPHTADMSPALSPSVSAVSLDSSVQLSSPLQEPHEGEEEEEQQQQVSSSADEVCEKRQIESLEALADLSIDPIVNLSSIDPEFDSPLAVFVPREEVVLTYVLEKKVKFNPESRDTFDGGGVLYWIGTDGGTREYINPHLTKSVIVSMSSSFRGSVSDTLSDRVDNVPIYSENAVDSWLTVDLGASRLLVPTHYTIRHGGSAPGNALRNWKLQAKTDPSDEWITLKRHSSDSSIDGSVGSGATWPITLPFSIDSEELTGFRIFRISQYGNNSGGNNCLFCGGVEFYGYLFTCGTPLIEE